MSLDYRVPRSIRNNNPGNIKYGKFAKEYGATVPDDKNFAVFHNVAEGLFAARELLQRYINEGHITIQDALFEWVGKDLKQTHDYLKFGDTIYPGFTMSSLKGQWIPRLLWVISRFEAGVRWIDFPYIQLICDQYEGKDIKDGVSKDDSAKS